MEFANAVLWALEQKIVVDGQTVSINKHTKRLLVEKVREYFNEHGISYDTFSYEDLIPYLPQ